MISEKFFNFEDVVYQLSGFGNQCKHLIVWIEISLDMVENTFRSFKSSFKFFFTAELHSCLLN